MDKKVKAITAAEQTKRVKYDGYTIEKGQGVLFFLDEREIYNGVHLTITDDGTLSDPNGYDGPLATEDDLKAFYEQASK